MAVRQRTNQKKGNCVCDSQNGTNDPSEPRHSEKLSNNSSTLSGSDNPKPSQMFRLCGFDTSDLNSWQSFVKLLCRPTDPSSLGIMRFVFGLLMFLDIFHERGLPVVDYIYGDPDECRFPLFNFLSPLPLQWMYVVYLAMILGSLGIMLGLFYRISCFVFLLCYWYVFLLDKTTWNNHSYLYGLCAFLLLLSDANRYWSIDGLLRPEIRNASVPLWNYSLLRTQFFLVYFVAGLKKLDMDWVQGYSMNRLSYHWIFAPFTHFMSHDEIDLWIVHRGGLTLDLTIGYLLFFDYTRPLGVVMGASFHIMNSQMFTIGMFPYTMLATMPIFSHVDWPKKLPALFSRIFKTEPPKTSSHCLYPNNMLNVHRPKHNKKKQETSDRGDVSTKKIGWYYQCCSAFVLVYVAVQCFLPYSHFLTKGYNNWTNGLYGYSWDMMVHSWSTQHIRITYVNKDTGEEGYLNPKAWTRGRDRWSSHVDMIKQYANCIEDRLTQHDIYNTELYFDVWRSLNDRFQQRMFDPRVDMTTSPWDPLMPTPWLMPLLTDLSDWRTKLDEIEESIYEGSNNTEVVFIADVPGLHLENFIQKDLGNTTLQVLHGQVVVELSKTNISLSVGEKTKIPANQYHKVHTVSDIPSCYMYIFVNTTEMELMQKLKEAEKTDGKDLKGKLKELYEKMQKAKFDLTKRSTQTLVDNMAQFVLTKYKEAYRGLVMLRVALQSILTQQSFEAVFNQTVLYDIKQAESQQHV